MDGSPTKKLNGIDNKLHNLLWKLNRDTQKSLKDKA